MDCRWLRTATWKQWHSHLSAVDSKFLFSDSKMSNGVWLLQEWFPKTDSSSDHFESNQDILHGCHELFAQTDLLCAVWHREYQCLHQRVGQTGCQLRTLSMTNRWMDGWLAWNIVYDLFAMNLWNEMNFFLCNVFLQFDVICIWNWNTWQCLIERTRFFFKLNH